MSVSVAIIRWLLVPVCMGAVAGAAFFGGRWVVSLADQRCAPKNLIGGACVEPWQTGTIEMVIYAGVVVMGLGLTLLPAVVAPALKRVVAVLGGLLALVPLGFIYFVFGWAELFAPMIAAALAGLCGIAWVWTRQNNKQKETA